MKIERFNESKLEEPKIGDYVICRDGEDELNNFLSVHIGQIIDIYNGTQNLPKNTDVARNYPYYVKYTTNEISDDLIEDFQNFGGDGIRIFSENEIIEFAINKNELELKMMSKKYNL